MTASPWLGIGFVLAMLVGSMACLHRPGRGHGPELARKTLHVIMGLVTLTFNWIFAELWPVLLLASLALAALAAVRFCRTLRSRLGGALYRVSRTSYGEIHFVLGTATLYALAAGNALLFCIPMLILTFADTAAALVGARYGRHRYAIGNTEKSLEGSGAFFAVALLCAYLPLALFTSLTGPQCALTALAVALVTTMLEGVGGGGLDNLLIPPGAFIVLKVSITAGALPTGVLTGTYTPWLSTGLLGLLR